MEVLLSLFKAIGLMAGILLITGLILWGCRDNEVYTLIVVCVALTGLLWWVVYQSNLI